MIFLIINASNPFPCILNITTQYLEDLGYGILSITDVTVHKETGIPNKHINFKENLKLV
jgi:hypothetical protein